MSSLLISSDTRDLAVASSAIVEEGAEVGEGTKIWHFCHVMRGAKIGRACSLGMGSAVAGGAVLGDRVRLQNHVSIFKGVILEDDVFCGPHACFTNVKNPRAFISRRHEFRMTRVGRGATIGANATVVCGINIGCFAFVAAGAVVTKDVPNFGLVQGVPAKLVGFVSQAAERLQFDASGFATCAVGGERYFRNAANEVQLVEAERLP